MLDQAAQMSSLVQAFTARMHKVVSTLNLDVAQTV